MGTYTFKSKNMSDDEQFDQADAGAMTFPCSAGSIRKGSHMLIKGFPCKVAEVTTSKTGKHGHAKASITGIDIFTGKKYEDSVPTSHNVDCPNVTKTEYTVISIDDGYVTLMDDAGEMREDLKLPELEDLQDVVEKLNDGLAKDVEMLCVVQAAMGQEMIISCRNAKN